MATLKIKILCAAAATATLLSLLGLPAEVEAAIDRKDLRVDLQKMSKNCEGAFAVSALGEPKDCQVARRDRSETLKLEELPDAMRAEPKSRLFSVPLLRW
jgi:hypothetical protein